MYTLIVVIIGLSFGLQAGKVGINFGRFPKTLVGIVLNLAFMACLGRVVYVLAMFWISWTMIEALQALVPLVPVTLVVGNFAMLQRSK